MNQLWNDERIKAEIQQCIQSVENSEVVSALEQVMQAMRNAYEERIN